MRIVTLLPAATEIVAALGAGAELVGVSHECDHPPGLESLPRVTTTPIDPALPSGRIDAEVRRARAEGRAVIAVEAELLRRLAPDLVVTQDLCEVCAVADGVVHRLAAALSPAPEVLSLRARDLDGIRRDIRAVGAATGRADEAERLVRQFDASLDRVRRAAPARAPAPRVVCVEWLDPVYLAGHWVPELVVAAGGHDVGAAPGSHSVPRSWSDVARLEPDVIVVMLCGFGVERARQELMALEDPEGRALLRRIPTSIIDGNAYTSRPGPRVVEGAMQIQAAMREAIGYRLSAIGQKLTADS